MLDYDLGFVEALGARGRDIVEANDVKHRGAHVAGIGCRLKQAEDGDRHDRLLEAFPIPLPTGGGDIGAIDKGQPTEIDAEDQDQQQSREEGRQRKTDKGHRVGDLVEDRIGPHRGIHADRKRNRQSQDLRRADDEQRGRDPLQDQLVDVDAACERKAPVAVQHRDQPAHVANENRIVDPEFHPQRLPDLGWNIAVGGELAERIARRQRQQHKKNETDAEQTGKSDDQTSDSVFSHSRVPP